MPTNAEILSFAPGAGYLAGNDVQNSGLFNNFARLNKLLPRQIYALYFVIKKIYDLNPNYAGMDVACNYLWEVMGRYGIKSQGLSGGGGSVAPVTPFNTPTPYVFYVDTSTTLLVNGQSSATITAFIGFNLIFNRNGLPQSTLTSEPTYYTWNKTTGLFTCSPAAITSELFQLIPA